MEFFQGTLRNRDEIRTARVFDTTLRDGEQTPGTSFSFDDKREIAAALDEAGVDAIEAGFPINSEAEREAVSAIASATETTTVALARVVDDDVECALETGAETVHVFCSTSDVQLADSMHTDRAAAKRRSVAAVERVADAGANVIFSPMDATRTEESYLFDVIEAADRAGADWINVPDTCGVATPGRFRQLIDRITDRVEARVEVHAHDDFGLATANSLAGYEAGAARAQVAVNGIGERAGNAALEEVVAALDGVYDAATGVDTTKLAEVSRLVERRSDVTVPPNKPVVGTNAFAHESGIHAAGVIENSATFEPGVIDPETVGGDREIVLGKHTGTNSVRDRLTEMGFEPTDREVREVTRTVKEYCADGGRVEESDLVRFARDAGVSRREQEATAD